MMERKWEEFEDFAKILLEMLEKLGVLTPKEKNILVEYYLQKKSLREIAENLRVSRERIHQMRDKAVLKIKSFTSGKLIEYLLGGLERIEKKLEFITSDSIEKLNLCPRTTYALQKAGISTIRELKAIISKFPYRLMKIRGFGMKHLREIQEKLSLLEN